MKVTRQSEQKQTFSNYQSEKQKCRIQVDVPKSSWPLFISELPQAMISRATAAVKYKQHSYKEAATCSTANQHFSLL